MSRPRHGLRAASSAWRATGALVLIVLLHAASGRTAAAQVDDAAVYTFVLFDELEFQPGTRANLLHWDAEGWVGGDFDKLWIKSEGDQATEGGEGDAELQVLFSRLISPFFDLQAGVRLDVKYGGDADEARALAAFGIEGLAPYWFEIEVAGFVSHRGDVSLRATGTYDMLFTQRLIGQPRAEINLAIQEVPEFGVGSGLNDVELGWRMRYEVRREFAPYLGISWIRRIGSTAELARGAGDEASEFSIVGGLRMWF